MNKKVYVCPSVMTRDVRVSMAVLSGKMFNAQSTIFPEGTEDRDMGFGMKDKSIDVDNNGIWGNGID